ncbi:MAG TPA: hypothetical protein PLV68_16890, partial [Ilumatobacteraceae bacterium]|nr:hypothetical protein [Ilumatobacteraceae bacterium]
KSLLSLAVMFVLSTTTVQHVPTFASFNPARLLDTRADGETTDGLFIGHGRIDPGVEFALQVGGRGGVEADDAAVSLNVTATDATGTGFVTVWPCGTAKPLASSLNFVRSEAVANAVIT